MADFSPGRGISQPSTSVPPSTRRVQVLDSNVNNVTPVPLYHAKPGEILSKPGSLFLEEVFSRPYISDSPAQTPATSEIPQKIDNVTQHVTEECLAKQADVFLTESDTISLLDLPNILVSEDDEDAQAIKEKSAQYTEICKMRLRSDNFLDQAVQTLSGVTKDKQVQCNNIVMVDKDAIAMSWDIYDLCANQGEGVKVIYTPPGTVDINKGREKRLDPQGILLPESFQHSLLVMERNILTNIFQPKLAAYRGLPILEGKPENEEQNKNDQESPLTPTLEPLWAFSCRLTKGCNITSMAWNKKNPDLLAVGYGSLDSRNHRPSFICCWSLKNFMWPERVFHCHSCVTSLDFSAKNPSQLAVGMFDGTVAIYNVMYQDNGACIANSSKCLKKHLHPVWQVIWKKQEVGLEGEGWEEALVSVSADGRITKWLLSSSGLDSLTDLMNLRKHDRDKNTLAAVTTGLCIDFHPTNYNIYLVGMENGLVHMRSLAICDSCLETYETHISSVNHIEWSPFSPELFLSCSSDWTIQLWKQGHFAPLLSFTSTKRAVYTAKWSPNWPTVFAAINEQQLEIWNLNSNTRSPTIVHHSAPGVEMTALLFATGTDCVLVGDSDGKVTVYKIKNIMVGEGKQVDNLDDVIKP